MRASFIGSLLASLLVAGCSGASPDEPADGQSSLTSPSPTSVARMPQTRVIDLRAISAFEHPIVDARQIIVTIARVDAQLVGSDGQAGEWVTVSNQSTTLDLLTLQGGTFAQIGAATLPANGVDRLRLQIDPFGKNFVETADGLVHGLVVPDDAILVQGDLHDLTPCATGSVTLQFRGDDGIVASPIPNSDAWQLRPVIWLDEVRVALTCPPPGQRPSSD